MALTWNPARRPCYDREADSSVTELELAIARCEREIRQRLARTLNRLSRKYKNGALVRAA